MSRQVQVQDQQLHGLPWSCPCFGLIITSLIDRIQEISLKQRTYLKVNAFRFNGRDTW